MSREFGLAAFPEEAEGRHRKAARGQSSAGLDPKVSLLCSASPQIPALAAITRDCLALDLILMALDLDSILLTWLRATTHYISLLTCTWTQIFLRSWYSIPGMIISHGEAERFKMPPDVKWRGLLPDLWLLNWVLLQRAGNGCRVKKMCGFVFRKSLHCTALTWSIPHHQALSPDPQLSLGTFTQISSSFDVLLAMLWFWLPRWLICV